MTWRSAIAIAVVLGLIGALSSVKAPAQFIGGDSGISIIIGGTAGGGGGGGGGCSNSLNFSQQCNSQYAPVVMQ